MTASARLLITCTDRPGIVAAVSGFLTQYGGNIAELDQHTSDPDKGTFFMRVAFWLSNIEPPANWLKTEFQREVAEPFGMDWLLSFASQRKRMAILVSRPDHALMELLWRWSRGELPADLTGVISNHPDNREAVESFGLAYRHIPVDKGAEEEAETALLDQLSTWEVDLMVLARYMRILSPEVVARYPSRIINIHHSFLPAFAGPDPYRQAFQRGVKLIGATAHYATGELDAGPVIDQDVVRVSHREGVGELRERGRDVERSVLARAVRWHLEDRIAVWGNRTVVFGT